MSQIDKIGKKPALEDVTEQVVDCALDAAARFEAMVTSSVESFILNDEQSVSVEASVNAGERVAVDEFRSCVENASLSASQVMDDILGKRIKGMEGLFIMPAAAKKAFEPTTSVDLDKLEEAIHLKIEEGFRKLITAVVKQAARDGMIKGDDE